MKWAKVSKGRVHHVWPYTKPDGTVKELPLQYRGLNGKPVPSCIVQVPDDVHQNWVWHEDQQKYGPVIKKPMPKAISIKDYIDRKIEEALKGMKDGSGG